MNNVRSLDKLSQIVQNTDQSHENVDEIFVSRLIIIYLYIFFSSNLIFIKKYCYYSHFLDIKFYRRCIKRATNSINTEVTDAASTFLHSSETKISFDNSFLSKQPTLKTCCSGNEKTSFFANPR